MNFYPRVYCPFCGTTLKVMDNIPAISQEGIINLCSCKCGVLEVVVRYSKVVAIRIHKTEFLPDVRTVND